MTALGMGRKAGAVLSWDRGEWPKKYQRDRMRARTARLVPIELPEPEEKPWLWECPADCGCPSCVEEFRSFDSRALRVVGAPPERQPDCDLPGCPMCFAARKWLPEKDSKTLEQWRRGRVERTL